jgi:hypothetical protein
MIAMKVRASVSNQCPPSQRHWDNNPEGIESYSLALRASATLGAEPNIRTTLKGLHPRLASTLSGLGPVSPKRIWQPFCNH